MLKVKELQTYHKGTKFFFVAFVFVANSNRSLNVTKFMNIIINNQTYQIKEYFKKTTWQSNVFWIMEQTEFSFYLNRIESV